MRGFALFGLAMLLAPLALAKGDASYPSDLAALTPAWIAETEKLATEADRAKPWWPDAQTWLDKAHEASDAGRVRITMFQLETFSEIVIAHQLEDQSQALGSDAERRTFIARRTTEMKDDSERAWSAFRATLHGYDGQMRSLQAVETALYASDVALTSVLSLDEYAGISKEFPKQAGVPMSYVLALVRASHTPSLDIAWASDILEAATKKEGVPPRTLDEPWSNLTKAALATSEGEPPNYISSLEARGKPIRENNESIMAIALVLAEQRSGRAYGMQTIFGDAGTRGKDVVHDAATNMNKQLANTSLDTPRSYGLEGVFTADAMDRARYTTEFVEKDQAELGTVIVSWAALDHANYVINALGSVSPVVPPAVVDETPGFGFAFCVLGLAMVALAWRRR